MTDDFVPGTLVILKCAYAPFVYLWNVQLDAAFTKFCTNDLAIIINGNIDSGIVSEAPQKALILICGTHPQIGYVNTQIICCADEIKSEQRPAEIL